MRITRLSPVRSKRHLTAIDGFTIVEVLIALAIVAIILVAVIIAIRQYQSAQRDAARKANVDGLIEAIHEYANSHNGAYPTCVNVPDPQYANEGNCNYTLPSGYKLTAPLSVVYNWTVPTVYKIEWGGPWAAPGCVQSGSAGFVQTLLESGSYYCVAY